MATDVREVLRRALQEWTDQAGRAADGVLAALADAGVELVADLPAMEPGAGSGYVAVEGGREYKRLTPAEHRRSAADHLAIARHLEVEPDPADVAELTVALDEANADGDLSGVARALLASGKVTVNR